MNTFGVIETSINFFLVLRQKTHKEVFFYENLSNVLNANRRIKQKSVAFLGIILIDWFRLRFSSHF